MHQMKLDNNVFFTTKKHKMIRKISWKVRRMLAVKAASMIFFFGSFRAFRCKKKPLSPKFI